MTEQQTDGQQQQKKPRPMIEIIARQMAGDVGAKTLGEHERENYTERYWREFMHQARSVLLAIRKPTHAMIDAGGWLMYGEALPPDMIWENMIDAALQDK